MKRQFVLKRQNFKKDPFWIDIECDGRYIGCVWSAKVLLSRHKDPNRWMLNNTRHDVFFHADELLWKGIPDPIYECQACGTTFKAKDQDPNERHHHLCPSCGNADYKELTLQDKVNAVLEV